MGGDKGIGKVGGGQERGGASIPKLPYFQGLSFLNYFGVWQALGQFWHGRFGRVGLEVGWAFGGRG